MRRFFLNFWMAASVSAAFAENIDGLAKYRSFLPEQITEMTKEERGKVPTNYLIAANTASSKGAHLYFASLLNKLMYAGVSDYQGAIKSFQGDIAEEKTGLLTVGQISDLEWRASLQDLKPVTMSSSLQATKEDSIAVVSGTMILIDDKLAFPVNLSRIICYKIFAYCEFNQTYLALPTNKSWVYNYSLYQADPEYFKITSWDDETIEAIPYSENNIACRRTSLSLNFKAKEFFYTTKNTGRECEIMGKTLPKLPKPRIGQIVDGNKVIDEEFSRLAKAAYSVLSSRFRASIEKLDAPPQVVKGPTSTNRVPASGERLPPLQNE